MTISSALLRHYHDIMTLIYYYKPSHAALYHTPHPSLDTSRICLAAALASIGIPRRAFSSGRDYRELNARRRKKPSAIYFDFDTRDLLCGEISAAFRLSRSAESIFLA